MIQKDINYNSVDKFKDNDIKVYKFYTHDSSLHLTNKDSVKFSFDMKMDTDLLFVSFRDPVPFFSFTDHKHKTFIKPHYHVK